MRIKIVISILALSILACSFSASPASIGQQTAIASIPPKSELENAPVGTPTDSQQSETVTAVETVYIRLKPDYRAKIIGYLMHGESVTVFECAGDWARIGAGRWVNSYYLSVRCK